MEDLTYDIEDCECIMEACKIRMKELRNSELKDIWGDKYHLAKALKLALEKLESK